MTSIKQAPTIRFHHLRRRRGGLIHFHCPLLSGICSVVGCLVVEQTGRAQVVFTVADLPSRVGVDYNRAYLNTNRSDVSTLLGQSGAGRHWDFSQPRHGGDVIQRSDIVAAGDGGHGVGYPDAAYAERDTIEFSGRKNWSYYRLLAQSGRNYYGFYDANSNPTCPGKLFRPPTVDLPDGVHYGQTWSRALDFDDCVGLGGSVFQLTVHFTATSAVDAWGTVVLPEIGEVPALRVNEVNTYQVSLSGLTISTQSYRNYHWLVRGIGKAVTIISEGSSSVPPENFATAKTVLRVFEASAATDRTTMRPVQNLHVRREGNVAVLDWLPGTNTHGYVIQTTTNLPAVGWSLLAEPMESAWSNAITFSEPQRYFRVLAKP